jgi:hypothetical protein
MFAENPATMGALVYYLTGGGREAMSAKDG